MKGIKAETMLDDKDIDFLKNRVKRKWESIFLFICAALLFIICIVNMYSINEMRKVADLNWTAVLDLTDQPSLDRNYLPEEMFISSTVRKSLTLFVMFIFFTGFGVLLIKQKKYYSVLLEYIEKHKT